MSVGLRGHRERGPARARVLRRVPYRGFVSLMEDCFEVNWLATHGLQLNVGMKRTRSGGSAPLRALVVVQSQSDPSVFPNRGTSAHENADFVAHRSGDLLPGPAFCRHLAKTGV